MFGCTGPGKVDSLDRRAESLTAWGDSLATEPLVIERVARERYSFLRPGERVYRFVDLAEVDSAESGLDDEAAHAAPTLTSDSGGD